MKAKRWLFSCMALAALLLVPAFAAAQGRPEVAEPFRDYYSRQQGIRVLGYPLTELRDADGYPAQYFEKGRIEDHRGESDNPAWRFMYGRLTAELMERDRQGYVTGADITYGDLAMAASPALRKTPPSGFRGGVMAVPGGVFVPYDPGLANVPGQIVPTVFWRYITRTDLFPGGWLHDIGLPMTPAMSASTTKGAEQRTITIQAFERTVLTYDALNPPDWRVERGNIGADALRTLPAPAPGPIEIPAAGARVTLPLHVLARAGLPGSPALVRLRWDDGTELLRIMPALRGEDGGGLVIGNLNWNTEGPPPQPPTQGATLEIFGDYGDLLARQRVTVLGADDPNTQTVQVFWVLDEDVHPVPIRIPRTARVGTAALESLLWGPAPPNLAGFETAIPTPEQVLAYPGREADWGPRVTLRSLTIVNGVATADFSQELRAYGGGSLRVKLIRDQITRTLRQFATVREVRIAIEGQTEAVLEP